MQNRKKILVMDDEEFIGAHLLAELSDTFDVKVSTKIDEAFQLTMQGGIDAILLDINLGIDSGFEICKKLRDYPATKDIQIFLMTGFGSKEAQLQSYKAGADDYIEKPIVVEELKLRLTNRLKRRDDTAGQAQERPTACAENVVKAVFKSFAHELSNYTMILDMCSRAGKRVVSSEEIMREFEKISETIERQNKLLKYYKDVLLSDAVTTLKLKPTDLNKALAGTTEKLRDKAGRNNVNLRIIDFAEALLIEAEEFFLVKYVIFNLLDNVLNHAGPNSEIIIKGEALDNKTVVMTVSGSEAALGPEVVARIIGEVSSRNSANSASVWHDTENGLQAMRDFLNAFGGSIEVKKHHDLGVTLGLKFKRAHLTLQG